MAAVALGCGLLVDLGDASRLNDLCDSANAEVSNTQKERQREMSADRGKPSLLVVRVCVVDRDVLIKRGMSQLPADARGGAPK